MSAIGVFDSGVGGLTVLKALRREMPHREFLYLGDTARVPYWAQTAGNGKGIRAGDYCVFDSAGGGSNRGGLQHRYGGGLAGLQREFSVPVWGVIEPGVEAAVRATRTGHVGVIGTKGAIRSGAYQRGWKRAV